MKKPLIFALTLALCCLFLFSCGGRTRLSNAFRADVVTLPDELSGVFPNNIASYGGTAYSVVRVGNSVKIIGISDKVTLHDARITIPEGGYFSVGQAAAGDGSVWFSASGTEPDGDGMTPFTRIYRFSGGKTTEIYLDDGSGFVSGIAADGDSLVMAYAGLLWRVTPDGELSEFPSDDSYIVNGVVVTGSGAYADASANDQDGGRVLIPISGDSFGGAVKADGVKSFVSSGTEKKFSALTNAGIDSCAVADGEIILTRTLDFVSSDIDPDQVRAAAPLDGGRFAALLSGGRLCVLSPVPEDELPEKEIIKVAATNPRKIRSEIIEFNKQSADYHLTLVDYSEYEDAAKRLGADLVSKTAPDILVVSDDIDFDGYARMNLFADLYTLMGGDSGDYPGNVLEAYEKDGKLTSIVTRFKVQTFAAKKKLVGDIGSFTTESFVSFAAEREIDMLPAKISRAEFLRQYIRYNRARLSEEGFGDDELGPILKFAKTLPENAEGGDFRDDELFIEERVLLSDEEIGGFSDYEITKDMTFDGDDAVYLGFPTPEGGTRGLISAGESGYELAVLKSSKHKSGTWEFISYLLSEEKQAPAKNSSGDYVVESGFPVRKSAFEEVYEISVENDQIAEADAESLREFILSVDSVCRDDPDMLSVVYEDASAYFSGAKTIDETIKIIRDRIGTLLSERKF